MDIKSFTDMEDNIPFSVRLFNSHTLYQLLLLKNFMLFRKILLNNVLYCPCYYEVMLIFSRLDNTMWTD